MERTQSFQSSNSDGTACSAYLVVGLRVNRSAPLSPLQGLLDLLHLDGQMGLEEPAQGHAGVLGCLPAGEDLVITQQGPLVLRVQDLQCADLETVEYKINSSLIQRMFRELIWRQ